MKRLYHVPEYRLISVYAPIEGLMYGRTHKELDICDSLQGIYRVERYPLTNPSIKLNICYIK